MCGIVGSTAFPIYRNHLNYMSNRGPTGRGLYSDNEISIGHVRLAIIGLDDPSAIQPIEDERHVLSFNGEIYNYEELTNKFFYGHKFESDTSLLFNLLKQIGVEETIQNINGMFAFCFYDKIKKEVYLVRDRLGKKPIFYSNLNSGLSFASDLKLLRELIGKPSKLDDSAITIYFSTFYIPSPYTIYKDIRSLEAGSYLKYEILNKTLSKKRYWSPSPRERSALDEAEFFRLFQDSSRIRLKSDVPLGAFLSGGVDSSLTTISMSDLGLANLKTFTAGVKDTLNEEKYANIIANQFKTDHTVCDIEKTSLRLHTLRDIIKKFGQPFADSSIVPTDRICQKISDHVVVAISGDGADEIFMGYSKYLKADEFKNKELDLCLRNKNLDFLTKDHKKNIDDIIDDLIPDFRSLNSIEKINQFDLRVFLEGDILQKIDRLSMGHSLEVRSPFLDYRIVELGLSTSLNNLICDGQTKFFLKKMLEKRTSTSFAFRDKIGFMLSINEWRVEITALLRQTMYSIKEINIIDKNADLERLDTYTLFSLLIFSLWFEDTFM